MLNFPGAVANVKLRSTNDLGIEGIDAREPFAQICVNLDKCINNMKYLYKF